MAVIRLTNGELFVWSPVQLDAALRAEVDALGPVTHLVEPNALHHLFLPDWVKAYPAARTYAPPGLKKKRRDIRFDAELGDAPEPSWAGQIKQIVLKGSVALTEIFFFHYERLRTALICNSIQSFPRSWFKGWRGLLARLDGIVQPSIGAPGEWRLSFLNRKAARTAVERLLALAPERVLAHSGMVASNGADLIRRGFAWLLH